MNSSIDKNMLSNEDNLLLRAWQNGELSGADEEALEKRLFFEPALAEAASIDQDIRQGIALPQRSRDRTPQRTERLWPLLAAASIGAMAVLVPIAYHETTQPESTLLGNVEWVRLDYTRGTGDAMPTLISPSSGTGAIILEVPAPPSDGPFEARVMLDGEGKKPLTTQHLMANDGALTILLPKDVLRSGTYMVEISTLAMDKPAMSLSFRYQQ